MIWKLIRYSPAWPIVGWASLIYSAAWLILTQGHDTGAIVSAPIMLYMGYNVALSQVPEAAFRCTFFDAALPVQGRDVWVSKMIVLLGMVWIPVLAMSAVGFAVVRDSALPLLNAAAGYTAILLAAQSFRIREFHEPLLVRTILFVAGGIVIIVMAVALPEFATRVLAGYLLANVAFFLLAWSRVPKCFEVATTKPMIRALAKRTDAGVANSTPIRVWWKILRQIYITYLFVLVALVWIQGGASIVSIIFIVPLVVLAARSNWNFLGYLPVSPRKLFWAIWIPLLFAMFLGYQVAVHFPMGSIRPVFLGPRITAINWAINLALLLSWMFSFQLWAWHRTRRFPVALKALIMAVVPAAAWIATPSSSLWRRYGADPIPYFAVKWADALPQNPWLLAILLLVPLAALYLLVERSFCEIEYSLTRTVGQGYLQGR